VRCDECGELMEEYYEYDLCEKCNKWHEEHTNEPKKKQPKTYEQGKAEERKRLIDGLKELRGDATYNGSLSYDTIDKWIEEQEKVKE